MSEYPTILVLDDEEAITTLLEDTLSLDGFTVLVSNKVDEFQRLASSNRIDVFILDLVLPHASGLEIAKEIRKHSSAGIIILTGQASEIDVVLGLELGADDYIAKPFRSRELRARVASVYRRIKALQESAADTGSGPPAAGSRSDEIFRFDDWTLNLASRSVQRDSGEKLDLTTSEFDVFAFLVKSNGRVVTRNQIIDAIRGEDWASYDRLIDGLISRIRKKLASVETDVDRIKTIRGVGYMFETRHTEKRPA